MTDDPTFSKNALIFKAAIHIALSKFIGESKCREIEKEKQLFYLVIKLTKPFAAPKTCTGWKTGRHIGIIFFRAGNYTDLIENFQ